MNNQGTGQGTLLADLDGGPGDLDSNIVQSILSDLNQPSGGNPVMSQGQNIPPPMGQRAPIQNANAQYSTYPQAADPAVPTAHLIGRDHPTPADFQRMMSYQSAPAHPPAAYNNSQYDNHMNIGHIPTYSPPMYQEPKKNWQGQWLDELREPLMVAIIVFLVTLPALNILISTYLPNLLRPGGDFTPLGMAARAALGGALYWALKNVVVPLLRG